MATVLIVDDDPAIVELLRDIVTTVGHHAIGSTSGSEAFVFAQTHQPALILSDLYMPDMNGYELIEALRADPLLANITVLLMSAGSRPPELPARTAFLLKPLDLALIESFVRRIPVGKGFS